jgi:hypothetical protein
VCAAEQFGGWILGDTPVLDSRKQRGVVNSPWDMTDAVTQRNSHSHLPDGIMEASKHTLNASLNASTDSTAHDQAEWDERATRMFTGVILFVHTRSPHTWLMP